MKNVVSEFGSAILAAEFFGVHRQTIYDWKEDLPELYAYRLKESRPDIYYRLTHGQ